MYNGHTDLISFPVPQVQKSVNATAGQVIGQTSPYNRPFQ